MASQHGELRLEQSFPPIPRTSWSLRVLPWSSQDRSWVQPVVGCVCEAAPLRWAVESPAVPHGQQVPESARWEDGSLGQQLLCPNRAQGDSMVTPGHGPLYLSSVGGFLVKGAKASALSFSGGNCRPHVVSASPSSQAHLPGMLLQKSKPPAC